MLSASRKDAKELISHGSHPVWPWDSEKMTATVGSKPLCFHLR